MDIAKKYFNCSSCERAAFEAGIKLGAIYHQFIGTPIDTSTIEKLEEAIKVSLMVQPFVENAEVRIDRSKVRTKRDTYEYSVLDGEMLDIRIKVRYEKCSVVARLKYIEEIRYPLMYIEEVCSE